MPAFILLSSFRFHQQQKNTNELLTSLNKNRSKPCIFTKIVLRAMFKNTISFRFQFYLQLELILLNFLYRFINFSNIVDESIKTCIMKIILILFKIMNN